MKSSRVTVSHARYCRWNVYRPMMYILDVDLADHVSSDSIGSYDRSLLRLDHVAFTQTGQKFVLTRKLEFTSKEPSDQWKLVPSKSSIRRVNEPILGITSAATVYRLLVLQFPIIWHALRPSNLSRTWQMYVASISTCRDCSVRSVTGYLMKTSATSFLTGRTLPLGSDLWR
jgi:hypothetical protein